MSVSPLTHLISRSTWYVLAVIYASMFAMVIGTALYSNYVARQSEQKWCGVLRVYHNAYRQNPPPPTQLGKDIQKQLEQQYVQFHCASVKAAEVDR